MRKAFTRRDTLKMGLGVAACATVGVMGKASAVKAGTNGDLMLRAGIITDMHQASQADSGTRRYSAAMDKMKAFMDGMKDVKPDFVIELGDFVDTLAPGMDPVANVKEIETLFTSFAGPAYHVLGNHDFDNLRRDQFLNAIPNTGIPRGQTWYSWDAGGGHCIVLDAGYTPGTYRPYDMNTPEDRFWTWVDTCVPPQEMEWLKRDLQRTTLPVLVFTHQTLNRVDGQDHTIKNASAVRALLKESGRVLAVISGHDHQGGYSNIKGIHYLVLNGNVGVNDSHPWSAPSAADGPYLLAVAGYGRQPGYFLERTL